MNKAGWIEDTVQRVQRVGKRRKCLRHIRMPLLEEGKLGFILVTALWDPVVIKKNNLLVL